MLALWSRVARSPGTCRCISCISNGAAVNRRGGLVGFRRIRELGMPTSIFAYTAVFTAGLTTDVKAKRSRNVQWSAAFTRLQHSIDQDPKAEGGYTESMDDYEYTPAEEGFVNGVDWETIHRVSGTEVDYALLLSGRIPGYRRTRLPNPPPTVDLDVLSNAMWDVLKYDSFFSGGPALEWPVNTGPDLIRYNLPPQSLWAPENMRLRALRKRQYYKKLIIQELAVAMLIYKLLAVASCHRLPPDTYATLSPEIQEAMKDDDGKGKNIRRLKRRLEALYRLPQDATPEQVKSLREGIAGIFIPRYFQDEDGDFYAVGQRMNDAIKDNFARAMHNRYDMAQTTVKICHNLLVSSAGPGVQTFNILIAGFGRCNQPMLVDAVIRARERCKIRPNEITCAAVLNHYIKTDRPDLFSRFISKMRGAGNSLMLARPDVTISEVSNGRLVHYKEGKVKQKVYATPIVFNILMLGVLRFAGFDRAIEVYYEMKEDGWGMDVIGLSHFLEDCIRHADWEGGLHVWQEIESIKHRVKYNHMAKAYAQMLSLCTVTRKTAAFNQVLSDLTNRKFDRNRILRSAIGQIRTARNRELSEIHHPPVVDNVLTALSDWAGAQHGTEQNDEPFAAEGDFDAEIQEAYDEPLAAGGDVDAEGTQEMYLESSIAEGPAEEVVSNSTPDTITDNSGTPAAQNSPALSVEEAWFQHELGLFKNHYNGGSTAEECTSGERTAEEAISNSTRATTTDNSGTHAAQHSPALSDDEAWALWLQHELGENPLQDTKDSPDQDTEKAPSRIHRAADPSKAGEDT